MKLIQEIFNNREIALIIWLSLAILFFLTKKDIRHSIGGIFKILFSSKILTSIISMLVYSSLIIYCLFELNLWGKSMLKDSIYWVFGVAFILLMNVNDTLKEERYFKKLLRDNFKLIILLEFISNLYSFGFIAELILVPILIIIFALAAYVETKNEDPRVKTFLNTLISIYGIVVIVYTIIEISKDYKSFISIENLRSFIFPLIMIVLFLPFLYFYSLFVLYESFFVRIKISSRDDEKYYKYAKRKLFKICFLNLRKLKKFSKELILWKIKSTDEFDIAVNEIRNN